ncbi:MAG: hypothetical protein QM630_05815 [Microbacterium sp.]
MTSRRAGTATIVLAAVILMVSCTGSPEVNPQGYPTESPLESLRAEAEAKGASQEQLDVIDKGADVSFPDYEQAVSRTVSCIKDAGINVIGDEVTDYRGFPEIRYSFAATSDGRSDEETLKVSDACRYTHSHWVEMLYQTSPSSVEAVEARFSPYRDALVSCLEEQGADPEARTSRDDLLALSYETLDRTGVDCVKIVGVPQ